MVIFHRKPAEDSGKRVITLQISSHFDFRKLKTRIKDTVGTGVTKFFRTVRFLEGERNGHMVRRSVSLAAMVCITAGTVLTAAAATKYAAVLVDDKPETVVEMTSTKTDEILKRAGVTAGANDLVALVQNTDKNKTGHDAILLVRTAKETTVTADGVTKAVTAHFGDTVADVLRTTGITVGENDAVTPPADSSVQNGMKISVRRRYNFTVTADGSTAQELGWEGTVADALKQAGVKLGTEDFPTPGPNTALQEGMKVVISRVTYRDVTSTQPIAYGTVTKKDDSMDEGTQSVLTEGRNGVKTTVTRQKLCNGKVVQSTVRKSEVTTQPVSRVVAVGTRSLGAAYASVSSDGSLRDENGSRVSYRKLYTGRCTCYCSGTTTASGLPAAYGRVAVNPNIIPYGTRLYICSPDGGLVYGYAVAADTGGAAMSGSIIADLYYPSYSQCMNIGTRTMNVYVLD